MQYKGEWFFPLLKNYKPQQFGQEHRLLPDYKSMKLAKQAWAVWPPNPWSPFESDKKLERFPAPPSSRHIFGTDDRGRDVFARLLYGFRLSIFFAVAVWAMSTLLAVLIGALSGFAGGKTDLTTQRFIEVLATVPQFFVLILLVSLFEPSMPVIILVSSFFGWIALAGYVRGEALKSRKYEYVEAARACGASNTRILLHHVLPNCLTPVITFTPFLLAGNIAGLAALDFLGFGLPAPTPSWGELLQQGQGYFSTAWWLATFPALALFIVLFSITLVGEEIRTVLDPMASAGLRKLQLGFAAWEEKVLEPGRLKLQGIAGGVRTRTAAAHQFVLQAVFRTPPPQNRPKRSPKIKVQKGRAKTPAYS